MFWSLHSSMHHSQWKKPYSRLESSLNLGSKRVPHSSGPSEIARERDTDGDGRAKGSPLKGPWYRVCRVGLLWGLRV